MLLYIRSHLLHPGPFSSARILSELSIGRGVCLEQNIDLKRGSKSAVESALRRFVAICVLVPFELLIAFSWLAASSHPGRVSFRNCFNLAGLKFICYHLRLLLTEARVVIVLLGDKNWINLMKALRSELVPLFVSSSVFYPFMKRVWIISR